MPRHYSTIQTHIAYKINTKVFVRQKYFRMFIRVIFSPTLHMKILTHSCIIKHCKTVVLHIVSAWACKELSDQDQQDYVL